MCLVFFSRVKLQVWREMKADKVRHSSAILYYWQAQLPPLYQPRPHSFPRSPGSLPEPVAGNRAYIILLRPKRGKRQQIELGHYMWGHHLAGNLSSPLSWWERSGALAICPAGVKCHAPLFVFESVHLGEEQPQDAFPLLPGQLADVNLALKPSPPLGLAQVLEHVVGAAVRLFESAHTRVIALACMRGQHLLLVHHLGVTPVLSPGEHIHKGTLTCTCSHTYSQSRAHV